MFATLRLAKVAHHQKTVMSEICMQHPIEWNDSPYFLFR